MKMIKLFFSALVVLTGMQVKAQTADEVIDKYVEAMGGKEKLAALKTVKMSGSMSVQGTDVTLTITKSHMAGMRVDMEIMGSSNYQVANTKEGWVFMPVMGMGSPQQMDEEQFKSTSSQFDVQGALFNAKEKGSTVEMVGKEKVDGAEAYNMKVTYQTGKTANFYIDTKTNSLIKTSSKAMVQGQEMDMETSFSDYKQNTDGYWFAYTTTNMQGTITFDKIESNVKVDDSIFKN
jgi:hypothetical protein